MTCPTRFFSLIAKKVSAFFGFFSLSPLAEEASAAEIYTELVSAMEDDWDLHAVVRGCNATATTAVSSSSASASASFSASIAGLTSQASASDSPGYGFSTLSREKTGQFFSVQDPFEGKNNDEELHELYKPFFFPKSPVTEQPRPISSPATAVSQFSFPTASKAQAHQKQSHGGSGTAPRTKRRKNQMKNVCQVPAESLSSDIWAWRKYGQKPIKGSPYPRGYYRCSSSKGCLARKQVERNRSDPEMFIVTYTAEHNHPAPTHRNSLAGSTRQKTSTAASVSSSDQKKSESELPDFSSSPSSENGGVPRSTTAESKEEKKDLAGDEEDEFGGSKMVLDDDFFVGFEELDSPATGDSFYDNFPANLNVSWMVT